MSLETVRKAVRVVDDPETIKVLADPMRREILRQLRERPQTETQLSTALGLSKPSVGYHLQTLMRAGLIGIVRTEIDSHGILEKYYGTVSKLFLENFESIPIGLRRYFLHTHIERLRGMLSVIRLLEKSRGGEVKITLSDLNELGLEIARRVSDVGKKYEMIEAEMNAESLLLTIYSEALKRVAAEHKWRVLDVLGESVDSNKPFC